MDIEIIEGVKRENMGNMISKYLKNIDIKKCITTILVLFVILNSKLIREQYIKIKYLLFLHISL